MCFWVSKLSELILCFVSRVIVIFFYNSNINYYEPTYFGLVGNKLFRLLRKLK